MTFRFPLLSLEFPLSLIKKSVSIVAWGDLFLDSDIALGVYGKFCLISPLYMEYFPFLP